MNEHERTQCATLAALLHTDGHLALWGLALSTVSAVALALSIRDLSFIATLGFGTVLLLGLAERHFAFRIRLDEKLFEGLANGRVASLLALDVALERLSLRTAPRLERGLEERMRATRQLMQGHAVVVACQSLLFVLALLTENLV